MERAEETSTDRALIKESKMDELCDYLIKIPSEKTPIIQESHIMIGHIISALVESKMF